MRLLAVASTFLAFSNPPPVFERIAQCETGNNPAHSTRDFVSRFGIYRPAWNEFKPQWVRPVPYRRVHGERHPTVLEQNAVAITIARKVGLSAWSCHRMYGWVRNG